MNIERKKPWIKRYSRTWYAFIAIVTFVVIDHLSDLLHQANLRRFMHWQVVQAIRNTLEVVFAILGVAMAHRAGLKSAVRELGPEPTQLRMVRMLVAKLTFMVSGRPRDRFWNGLRWLDVNRGERERSIGTPPCHSVAVITLTG